MTSVEREVSDRMPSSKSRDRFIEYMNEGLALMGKEIHDNADMTFNLEPSARMKQAVERFEQRLPDLLQTHDGQWIAIVGEQEIFGDTKTEVMQRCNDLGVSVDDLFIALIR